MSLTNISVVLVSPQGDENIGMAARAMKNFGVTDLRLVRPVPYKTKAAYKWACGTSDVIENAQVFSSLKEALMDVSMAVGLSRRAGKLRPPSISFDKTISKIFSRARKGRVALVFGREADGLLMSELKQCELVVTIPTSTMYPSINLAQAVLLICHELFKNSLSLKKEKETKEKFVSRREISPVIKQMEKTLMKLGYDNKDNGKLRGKILRSFEELFGRGGLRVKDVNMFLGLLARIDMRLETRD